MFFHVHATDVMALFYSVGAIANLAMLTEMVRVARLSSRPLDRPVHAGDG